jgi:hypothetical protein
MAVHRQGRGDVPLHPLFSSFLTVLISQAIVVAGLMVALRAAVVRPGRVDYPCTESPLKARSACGVKRGGGIVVM